MAEYDGLLSRIRDRAHDRRSATDAGPPIKLPPISDDYWDTVEQKLGWSTSPVMREMYSSIYAQLSSSTPSGIANPPVTLEEMEAAEQVLGFSLPPLLRAIYLEVGNGGFGPGYGLLPLNQSNPSNQFEESVISLYRNFLVDDPEYPQWQWPTGMLPICDWGCALRSCVDCTQESAPVLRLDPELLIDGNPDGLCLEASSLYAWFEDWLENPSPFPGPWLSL